MGTEIGSVLCFGQITLGPGNRECVGEWIGRRGNEVWGAREAVLGMEED